MPPEQQHLYIESTEQTNEDNPTSEEIYTRLLLKHKRGAGYTYDAKGQKVAITSRPQGVQRGSPTSQADLTRRWQLIRESARHRGQIL